jgi:hypothetical protein
MAYSGVVLTGIANITGILGVPQMSKRSISKAVDRHRLFGAPPILEDEDAAAYEEFFGRIWAAIKPRDVIDEMFLADVAALEWEILRWRRLKLSLIRQRGLHALADHLSEKLEYVHYQKHLTDELTTVLRDNGVKDSVDLARKCAAGESDAFDKVKHILKGIHENLDAIFYRAQAQKAKELAHAYFQGEPDAVESIPKLLAAESLTIDSLVVKALAEGWDDIERSERLTTVAEGRRNACLREIDRRRADLAEALRRSVAEVEGREFDLIEVTPEEGKESA